MADRISNYIGLYIHKDQVGFKPGRQGPDQFRRATDIVLLLGSVWDKGPPQKGFLLSLDLMKALNSISWSFLVSVLQKWGFGQSFMNIIGAFYSNQGSENLNAGILLETLPNSQWHKAGMSLVPTDLCHGHRDLSYRH